MFSSDNFYKPEDDRDYGTNMAASKEEEDASILPFKGIQTNYQTRIEGQQKF